MKLQSHFNESGLSGQLFALLRYLGYLLRIHASYLRKNIGNIPENRILPYTCKLCTISSVVWQLKLGDSGSGVKIFRIFMLDSWLLIFFLWKWKRSNWIRSFIIISRDFQPWDSESVSMIAIIRQIPVLFCKILILLKVTLNSQWKCSKIYENETILSPNKVSSGSCKEHTS